MNKQEKETCSESNFPFDSPLILCDMLYFFSILLHAPTQRQALRNVTGGQTQTFQPSIYFHA